MFRLFFFFSYPIEITDNFYFNSNSAGGWWLAPHSNMTTMKKCCKKFPIPASASNNIFNCYFLRPWAHSAATRASHAFPNFLIFSFSVFALNPESNSTTWVMCDCKSTKPLKMLLSSHSFVSFFVPSLLACLSFRSSRLSLLLSPDTLNFFFHQSTRSVDDMKCLKLLVSSCCKQTIFLQRTRKKKRCESTKNFCLYTWNWLDGRPPKDGNTVRVQMSRAEMLKLLYLFQLIIHFQSFFFVSI